jgi:hypothetical protein
VNRIVRKHYPIERLPPDLRAGLQEHGWVNIEIELESEGRVARPLSPLVESGKKLHGTPNGAAGGNNGASAGPFSRWRHLRRADFASADEIVAHIRALREEWDRR